MQIQEIPSSAPAWAAKIYEAWQENKSEGIEQLKKLTAKMLSDCDNEAIKQRHENIQQDLDEIAYIAESAYYHAE